MWKDTRGIREFCHMVRLYLDMLLKQESFCELASATALQSRPKAQGSVTWTNTAMLAILQCLVQATDGKRDTHRERESEHSACVMYPMLLDVCAWHPKPHCWKGEVLISVGLETTLTFSVTTLTSAEGQQSTGISLSLGWVSSSHVGPQETQEVWPGP